MGINLNVDFPPLNMGLIEISRSHFEAIQKLFVHPWPAIVCFGVFYKFFGYIWEEIVFPEGLVKLGEINFEDLYVVLKLEFEVKN